MASSGDAYLPPKRPPAPATRQSSTATATSTPMSRSLSDGPQRTAAHKGQRQHLVGHGRVQRNTSLKNLSKLGKLAQARQQDDGRERHHRRNHSGPPVSAPSSPRPGFKRNASTGGVIARAAAHAPHGHAAIRKNHSSGHLPRQAKAVKAARKHTRSRESSRNASPEPHPSVRFDMGDDAGDDVDGDDDEGHDDGWTEESASQSPNTTRSNTRSNSVVLDPQRTLAAAEGGPSTPPQEASQPHAETQRPSTYALPDRTHQPEAANGGDSRHRSKAPDADMITSRLLQRSSSRNPLPQTSNVSATVVSDSHNARLLTHSSGSTLVDTPGRELVSRFMDGGSSAGTPKSTYLPSQNSPQSAGGELDPSKRNRSMPNFGDAATTPSKAQHRRSGTTTPTDLPLSRTQQKLMLQRASSNIEPHKLIPTIIPRTGQPPTFIPPSVPFAANADRRLDPRLQQQFNHVAVEYKVVRRYRNPVADAIVRIHQIPGVAQKTRLTKPRTSRPASLHGSSSVSTSFTETPYETEGPGSRRSRVSFENVDGSQDAGGRWRRQSFESQNERLRDEAEEICRRMWEAPEAAEGGD